MLCDLHAHMSGLLSACLDHGRPLQLSRGWLPSVAAQQMPADWIASFLKSSRAKDILRSDDSCRSLEQLFSYIANSTAGVSANGSSERCTSVHGLQSHLAHAVQAGIALNCATLVVNSYGNDQLVSNDPSWTRSAQQLAQTLLIACDGSASSIGGWGQPYGEERRLLFRVAGAELVAGPVTNAASSPPPPAPSSGAPVSATIGSLLNVSISLDNLRNLNDGGVFGGRPVIRRNGTIQSSICGELTAA